MNRMTVTVQFRDELGLVPPQLLEQLELLSRAAATHVRLRQGELSVSFVTDEQIRQLNAAYRGKNEPTDVLSFPLLDEQEIQALQAEHTPGTDADGPGNDAILGDILISVPRATQQAAEYGHSLERELGFLLVHGFLHLLGFDHHTEEDEQLMFALQEQILLEHGLTR